MEEKEISTSLARALDRIADFEAVQSAQADGITLEAVECLQEAVGIGEETRAVLTERVYQCERRSKLTGAIFLGVIVGLLAAQLAGERA
jgi:hypothetical protein